MIRRPPRSTLFPTRRSSDLLAGVELDIRVEGHGVASTGVAATILRRRRHPACRHGPGACLATVLHPGVDICPCGLDRKSTRLNSSHSSISYAVFCLKKKNNH